MQHCCAQLSGRPCDGREHFLQKTRHSCSRMVERRCHDHSRCPVRCCHGPSGSSVEMCRACHCLCRSSRTNVNFSAWPESVTESKQKGATFDQWLEPRQIALRPLLWEVSCDAYTCFKSSYEVAHANKSCFGVRRFKFDPDE